VVHPQEVSTAPPNPGVERARPGLSFQRYGVDRDEHPEGDGARGSRVFRHLPRRAQNYSRDAARRDAEPYIRRESVRSSAPEAPIVRRRSQPASNEAIVRDILAVGQSSGMTSELRDAPLEEKRHHF
jgi:hypothetical protein